MAQQMYTISGVLLLGKYLTFITGCEVVDSPKSTDVIETL